MPVPDNNINKVNIKCSTFLDFGWKGSRLENNWEFNKVPDSRSGYKSEADPVLDLHPGSRNGYQPRSWYLY